MYLLQLSRRSSSSLTSPNNRSVVFIGLSSLSALVTEMLCRADVPAQSRLGRLILIDAPGLVVDSSALSSCVYHPAHVGMSRLQALRLHLSELLESSRDHHLEIEIEVANVETVTGLNEIKNVVLTRGSKSNHNGKSTSSPVDLIVSGVTTSRGQQQLNQLSLETSVVVLHATFNASGNRLSCRSLIPGFSACFACHRGVAEERGSSVDEQMKQILPCRFPSSELIAASVLGANVFKFLDQRGAIRSFTHYRFNRLESLEERPDENLRRPNIRCENPLCQARQRQIESFLTSI